MRLSAPDSPIYALFRKSAEGKDSVLVLVNTDVEKENILPISVSDLRFHILDFKFDLLGQSLPKFSIADGKKIFTLAPSAAYCLAPNEKPAGLTGENYRRTRAQAAWAIEALIKVVPAETIDGLDWQWLAEQVEFSPANFLAAASEFAVRGAKTMLAELLSEAAAGQVFPRVVTWTLLDARRITLVPPGHWLLIQDAAPFRATLKVDDRTGLRAIHVQSIAVADGHVACFPPRETATDDELILERYAENNQRVQAVIRFLPPEPQLSTLNPQPSTLALLTNGIGGMARLCVDLGPAGEFQIRLRPRRELESQRAGGPPHFREAHPRMGQRRWLPLAAQSEKSRRVRGRAARRLAIHRQRGRRAHGRDRIARRDDRRPEHDAVPVQPPPPPSARTASNCPPTPTCA